MQKASYIYNNMKRFWILRDKIGRSYSRFNSMQFNLLLEIYSMLFLRGR